MIQFRIIQKVPVRSQGGVGEEEGLSETDHETATVRLNEIYEAIYEGAESFLRAEYTVCFWFVIAFAALIFVLVSWGTGWDMTRGSMTSISFLLGAFTSMASGYLGMKVAVYSNVRTTVSAQKPGYTECFNIAFRAGAVMGFALCGMGILMLYGTMLVFRMHYPSPEEWILLNESLTGEELIVTKSLKQNYLHFKFDQRMVLILKFSHPPLPLPHRIWSRWKCHCHVRSCRWWYLYESC